MANSRIDEIFRPLTNPERRPQVEVRHGAQPKAFMRFSCDSCGAQYMISDDKVGPNGVKVRCKRCSHIVLVKRVPTELVSEPAESELSAHAAHDSGARESTTAPDGNGVEAGSGERALDVELGQAFDAMFGERSAGDESESTPFMSQRDPSRDVDGGLPEQEALRGREAAAPAPSAPLANDWYVAIRDTQVGPLGPAAVKEKWEAGEIGPDSLVWRAGMADWGPLSSATELAQFLAPIPRAAPATKASAREEKPEAARGGASSAAAADGKWKPDAASALASLANAEIADLPRAQPAAPRPNGTGKSLVDAMNLPDAGGVDPTGAIPLPIKGLESGEGEPKRRSGVERDTAEVRLRRSTTRTVIAVAIGLFVLFGAAIAGVIVFFDRKLERPQVAASASASRAQSAAPVAIATPPAPAVSAQPPRPAAASPAPPTIAAVPSTPPPAPQAAATAPARPAAVSPQPVVSAPPKAPPAEPARPSKYEPAGTRFKRHTRVAAAEPRPEPPARAERVESPQRAASPADAPRRKTGDPLLDFENGSADSDLEREMNSGSGRRKSRNVYVPPPPGGELQDRVTDSQITEGVAGKISALRQCMDQQKAADPNLRGTLKLRWVITGDGAVKDVRCLTDEYARQPIAQCLSGVVKTIRFPRTRTSGQEVVFPFKF